MLVSGARATIQGLQSREDLRVVVILLSWIPASGRWRARTDAGEVIALKPECLFIDVSKPPICQALWRSSTPPSNPKRRVQTLRHTLGQMAFEANQGFVDAGGVAAVVQIAFGAWPEGGLAASQHWADEVVEVAPHVFHSARRVALSGLADMAAEGEPYVSALVSNALFREEFAPAAASLLSNYRWRQPFASMCCPHDRDQQQYMAERLCNIANCTTLKWAKSVCGGASAADVDASFCSAVAALVLPILHAIPSPVPEFAFESTAESKRAAKALRAARANELDRLLHRPVTREALIAIARAQGQTQMAEHYMAAPHEMLAAPQEPLEQKSDYMADGVARMLYAVWLVQRSGMPRSRSTRRGWRPCLQPERRPSSRTSWPLSQARSTTQSTREIRPSSHSDFGQHAVLGLAHPSPYRSRSRPQKPHASATTLTAMTPLLGARRTWALVLNAGPRCQGSSGATDAT